MKRQKIKIKRDPRCRPNGKRASHTGAHGRGARLSGRHESYGRLKYTAGMGALLRAQQNTIYIYKNGYEPVDSVIAGGERKKKRVKRRSVAGA
jgi:hypothetical protein